MQKYEYKLEMITSTNLGVQGREIAEELSSMAKNGWRLVSTHQASTGVVYLYFEKEVK